VSACEQAIQGTLRAPSTYRRIALTETSEVFPLEDYLAADKYDSDSVKEVYRKVGYKPVKRTMWVEYDAANGYGVPIRTRTECSYISLNGDFSNVSEMLVKLNGKDRVDRLRKVISRQQNLHR
jgi:hypothetical protein